MGLTLKAKQPARAQLDGADLASSPSRQTVYYIGEQKVCYRFFIHALGADHRAIKRIAAFVQGRPVGKKDRRTLPKYDPRVLQMDV